MYTLVDDESTTTHVLDADGLRDRDPSKPQRLQRIQDVAISKTMWAGILNFIQVGNDNQTDRNAFVDYIINETDRNAFVEYIIKLATNNGTVIVADNQLYQRIGMGESELLDWNRTDIEFQNWSSATTIADVDILQRHEGLVNALSREFLYKFLDSGKWDATFRTSYTALIEDSLAVERIQESLTNGYNPFFRGTWPTTLAKFYHWRAVDIGSRWVKVIGGDMPSTIYDPSVKFGYLYYTHHRNVLDRVKGNGTRCVRPLLPVPPVGDDTSTYDRDVTTRDIIDVPECRRAGWLFNSTRCDPYSILSQAVDVTDDDDEAREGSVCRRWRYIGRYPVFGPSGGSRVPQQRIELTPESHDALLAAFPTLDTRNAHAVISTILEEATDTETNGVRAISVKWDNVLRELGLIRDNLNPLDHIFISGLAGLPGSYWRPTYSSTGRSKGTDGKWYDCDMKWVAVGDKKMCPSTIETRTMPHDSVVIVWDTNQTNASFVSYLNTTYAESLQENRARIIFHGVEPVAYIYVPDDKIPNVTSMLNKFINLTDTSRTDFVMGKCMRVHETVCFLYSDVQNIKIECTFTAPVGINRNVRDLELTFSSKLELLIPSRATLNVALSNDVWTVRVDTDLPNSVSDVVDAIPTVVDEVLGRKNVTVGESVKVTSPQLPSQKLCVTFKSLHVPTGSPKEKAVTCANFYYDIPDMTCNYACRYSDITNSDLYRQLSVIRSSLDTKGTRDAVMSGGIATLLTLAFMGLSKLGETIFNALIEGLKDWIQTWDFNPELVYQVAESGFDADQELGELVGDEDTGMWGALTNLWDGAANAAIDASEEVAKASATAFVDGAIELADTMEDMVNETAGHRLNMGFGFLSDKFPAFNYQLGNMDELIEEYGSVEAAEEAIAVGSEELITAGEEFADIAALMMSATGILTATWRVRKWIKQQIIRSERDMYEKLAMWQETHRKHLFKCKSKLELVNRKSYEALNEILQESSRVALERVHNPKLKCRAHPKSRPCLRCSLLKVSRATAVRWVNDALDGERIVSQTRRKL